MRIIAGRLGGLRLPARVPNSARPTSDRVREALCSALDARGAFDDAVVLDLFAGTGALGFEALSRGARTLVSVDQDPSALRAIEENARALSLGDEARRLRADLCKAPKQALDKLKQRGLGPFSLVFADPPYAQAHVLPILCEALLESGLTAPEALFVLEHPSEHEVPVPAGFSELSRYRYGDTGITLLAAS